MKITPYCVFNGKRCNEWLNWVNLKVKLEGVICNLVKKKKKKFWKQGTMSIRKVEGELCKINGLDNDKGS